MIILNNISTINTFILIRHIKKTNTANRKPKQTNHLRKAKKQDRGAIKQKDQWKTNTQYRQTLCPAEPQTQQNQQLKNQETRKTEKPQPFKPQDLTDEHLTKPQPTTP
uniref:Uncharacterized protein n=1 Tax=viral metagenome TaxID=1070528 RepID=A0A6M3X4Q6_9ZZZZ